MNNNDKCATVLILPLSFFMLRMCHMLPVEFHNIQTTNFFFVSITSATINSKTKRITPAGTLHRVPLKTETFYFSLYKMNRFV